MCAKNLIQNRFIYWTEKLFKYQNLRLILLWGAMLKLMSIQTNTHQLTLWKTTFFREIPAEMLERVDQNWTKRMDHLKHEHLHAIIFKHQIIWTVLSIYIKISCIFLNFMCIFEKLFYTRLFYIFYFNQLYLISNSKGSF